MIATAIFLLILATILTAMRGNRRLLIVLQLVAIVAVGMLFAHHVTEKLGLSF